MYNETTVNVIIRSPRQASQSLNANVKANMNRRWQKPGVLYTRCANDVNAKRALQKLLMAHTSLRFIVGLHLESTKALRQEACCWWRSRAPKRREGVAAIAHITLGELFESCFLVDD